MTSYAAGIQSAADHVVILNYANEQFTPDPESVMASVNDSIEFRRGPGSPDGILRIEFDYPEHFSAPAFAEGDAPVVVTSAVPPGHGTYRCGLSAPNAAAPATVTGGAVETVGSEGN